MVLNVYTQYRLVYAEAGYALNNATSIDKASHAIENVTIGVARCHLLNTADKCPHPLVPGPWICSFISVESDGSIHESSSDLKYAKPRSTEKSSLTLVHNLSPFLMSCRIGSDITKMAKPFLHLTIWGYKSQNIYKLLSGIRDVGPLVDCAWNDFICRFRSL